MGLVINNKLINKLRILIPNNAQLHTRITNQSSKLFKLWLESLAVSTLFF